MSPVSPVFHTVVTVSIGLETYPDEEHLFYYIRCPCFKGRVSKLNEKRTLYLQATTAGLWTGLKQVQTNGDLNTGQFAHFFLAR